MWQQFDANTHIWQSLYCNICLTTKNNTTFKVEVTHPDLAQPFITTIYNTNLEQVKELAIKYTIRSLKPIASNIHTAIKDLKTKMEKQQNVEN